MKIYKKISLIVAMIAVITASSCKKLLVENPHNGLYPTYLGTQAGIFAAITGVLSGLRGYYTNEGNALPFYSGTDEQNFAASAQTQVYATYNGLNSGQTTGQFKSPYEFINTLNSAIQFGATVNFDPTVKAQYLAQAQFLRGFIYMYLTQSWGGVTATNPSGPAIHTTFITQPATSDQPATLSALWALIISDFTAAAANLPNTRTSSDPFTANGVGLDATAATAQAYLAKAYLCRAYSSAAVSGDFQQAATITASLIANAGTYKLALYPDYSQAIAQANDYGTENMFGFDMGADPTYASYNGSNGSGGNGINQLPVFFRWNYISNSGVNSDNSLTAPTSGANDMLRDMYNGRPYIRSRPTTGYTINFAFADQIHDSRYDNTFQTFWICNVATPAGKDLNGNPKGVLAVTTPVSLLSYIPPTNGDTAILFPGVEVPDARRNAFKGQMTTPAQYNINVFPTVKKFDDAIGRLGQNDFSTRPAIQMRFSEVYMMNAEANYMLGNTAAAIASLNVIRTRAAFRTPADGTYIPASQYHVTAGNQAAANATNANAMTIGTGPGQNAALYAQMQIPANTTIGSPLCGMDVILDEYTREYYGDLRRWFDLVRTNQLLRRVHLYNQEAAANIQTFSVLRPIPQDQINQVVTGPKYPQNTGY